MEYFPEIAYKPKEEMVKWQEQKLQELVMHLAENSPFYKNLFALHNINPSEIKTFSDLKRVPTTVKEDLQKQNFDFLCVNEDKIIEYSSTSGTLGSPVTIALTEHDLQRLAYNEYTSFVTSGGSADDIFQLMLTLDRQFMAGMAYYSGLRKLRNKNCQLQ